jgi:hypothetical protein
MDVYTDIKVLWPALCREVAKLKMDLAAPPAPLTVAPKPAELLDSGLPSGSHAEIPLPIPILTSWAQQGSNTVTPPDPAASSDRSDSQTAPSRHFQAVPPAAGDASEAPPVAMATLATLALRQALDALDRGRLDQVREILKRALADERGAGQGAQLVRR